MQFLTEEVGSLRRLLRATSWVTVGALLSLVVWALFTLAWLSTDAGHRWVCRYVEQWASNRLVGTVHIGGVSGPLLDQLVLHDVMIRAQDGRPAGRVVRLTLRYSLFDVLRPPRRIERVDLERPVVHLDQLRALLRVSHSPPSALTIERLSVTGGRIIAPSGTVLIDRIRLRLRVTRGPTSTVTVHSSSGRLRLPDRDRPLSAVGVARWSEEAIELPRWELSSPASRLVFGARIDRRQGLPRGTISVEAHLGAGELGTLLPAQRTLELTMRVQGTPLHAALFVRSNLPRVLGLGGRPLYGQAQLELGWGRQRLAPLRLRSGLNRLTGALLHNASGYRLRLDGLTLVSAWVRALTPLTPTVPLFLRGRVRLDGGALVTKLRLKAGQGRLWLKARLDRRRHRLEAHLRAEALAPRALSVQAPTGSLSGALQLEARLAGRRRGRLAARIEGRLGGWPVREGRLVARLANEQLQLVADARVGREGLRAQVALHRRGARIAVPQAVVELGRSRLNLRGDWSPADGLRLLAEAALQPVEARVLCPWLHLRQPLALRVSAAGPPKDVRGRIDLALGTGRVEAALRLDLPAQAGELQAELVEVDTAALGWRPRLRLSAALALRGRREASGLALDRIELAAGQLSWRGRSPGSIELLQLTGQARLGDRGEVRLSGLSGVWVGRHRTRALSARGQARWDPRRGLSLGSALVIGHSALALSGTLGVASSRAARPLRLSLQLNIDRQLFAELAPKLAYGRPLLLGMAAEGPLGALLVHGRASGLLGRQAVLAARLNLAGDGVTLSGLVLRLGKSRLAAAGRLAAGRLQTRLELIMAPGDLQRVWPRLEPQGPLRLRATAAGRWASLGVRAELRANPGLLHLGGRLDLTQRTGQLRIVADSFDLRAYKKTLMPGQLSGTVALIGGWAKGPDVWLWLDGLRGEMKGIPVEAGHARGHYHQRKIELHPIGLTLPGADVVGRLHATVDGELDAQFGLRVTDALALPAPLLPALLLGANQALVDGAVVKLRYTKQPGQEMTRRRALRFPGELLVKRLWHLLRG